MIKTMIKIGLFWHGLLRLRMRAALGLHFTCSYLLKLSFFKFIFGQYQLQFLHLPYILIFKKSYTKCLILLEKFYIEVLRKLSSGMLYIPFLISLLRELFSDTSKLVDYVKLQSLTIASVQIRMWIDLLILTLNYCINRKTSLGFCIIMSERERENIT